MKKFITIILAVGLLFTTGAALAQEIGVAWAGKSGMANRVAQGFEARLAEIAPQITLEYRRDLADTDALKAVMEEFQQNKVGMVILRSNGAKVLATMSPSIPTFIGGTNHPGHLGTVQNLDAPEGNITGVTYALSADSQFSTFTAVVPGIESVFLIVEEGHPSSDINDADTKATCAKLGFDYKVKYFSDTEDMKATVAAEKDNVSIFLIGAQALVMDAVGMVVEAAGSTPVLAYAQKPVKDGALCGLSADDVKLGGMLAESLVDVIVKGKALSAVPVKFDEKPKLYINAGTVEKLGLDISYDIISLAEIIE